MSSHHLLRCGSGPQPMRAHRGVYALRSRTHAVRVRVLMGRKGRPESRNVVAQGHEHKIRQGVGRFLRTMQDPLANTTIASQSTLLHEMDYPKDCQLRLPSQRGVAQRYRPYYSDARSRSWLSSRRCLWPSGVDCSRQNLVSKSRWWRATRRGVAPIEMSKP